MAEERLFSAVAKTVLLRIAADRIILVPMPARDFVGLLRECSLPEERILAIASEYLEQGKHYKRLLEQDRARDLETRLQNNYTRDYLNAESELLMEMQVRPSQTRPPPDTSLPSQASTVTRAEPYGLPRQRARSETATGDVEAQPSERSSKGEEP